MNFVFDIVNYLKFLLFITFSLVAVKASDEMNPDQNSFCLYGAWFNSKARPADKYIAPDEKWDEMAVSMRRWMATNCVEGNNVRYKLLYDGQSITPEQVSSSRAFFLQFVDFVDVRDIIRNIAKIIQILYKGDEGTQLAEKSQELLPVIFSDDTISIYLKADLARILAMMYEFYFNHKQKFMYADPSMQHHNIAELFSSYSNELEKFGMVMANSSMPPSSNSFKTLIEDMRLSTNVRPPGFENGAFIAQHNEILMEAFFFGFLRPFMDREVIDGIRSIQESDTSQIAFSMHGVVFLYEMLCIEDNPIYLDPESRKAFKTVSCDSFFTFCPFLRTVGAKWPDTIRVSARNKGKEYGRIPGLERVLFSSMVVETCLIHSCCAVIGEEERSVPIIAKLYAIYSCLQSCQSWSLLSENRRSFLQILRGLGFNDLDIPATVFPVMSKHHFLSRALHFTKLYFTNR